MSKKELYISTQTITELKDEVFETRKPNSFVISLVTGGHAKYTFNFEDAKEIKEGSFAIISPSTLFKCEQQEAELHLYLVTFTMSFLAKMGISKDEIEMVKFLKGGQATILNLSQSELKFMTNQIKELEKRSLLGDDYPYHENILKYSFRIFLFEIAAMEQRHNPGSIQKMSRKQNIAYRFYSLIDELACKERKVKYYASQLAISSKYLSEIINEIAGCSAVKLIEQKIIHELKFQLGNKNLTIAQIAEKLNFSDQSSMGKFFKRHTGFAPQEYRRTPLLSKNSLRKFC